MKYWIPTTILLVLPFIASGVNGYLSNPAPVIGYAEGATIETTTGYAIFQRGQVMPKYVLKTDATGTMEYLNPGPTPVYPSTFGVKLCYSTPFNIYSADPKERLEVWQDSTGMATVFDVLTVCPQFAP